MISTAQVAAIVVAGVGSLLLWANPKRNVNRAVFLSSAIVATWLGCKYMSESRPEHGLFWLRWVFSTSALIPLSLWLVKESIMGSLGSASKRSIRWGAVWCLTAVALFVLPFTEFFIPSYSTGENQVFGLGFRLFYLGIVITYGCLLVDSLRDIKHTSGARRLELQVWLCGGCSTAVLIYALIGLSILTKDPTFRSLQPIAVLVVYVGTAVAITAGRIFDARQIILVVAEKALLILIVTVVGIVVSRLLEPGFSRTTSIVVVSLAVMLTTARVDSWLNQKFHFVPEAGAARKAAFATAQRETKIENLEHAFRDLLQGWGQTEHVMILHGPSDGTSGGHSLSGGEFSSAAQVIATMKRLRWITPERLARERQTPERRNLADFLTAYQLGILVIGEGPTVTTLVGVGVGASRRPYTYPQVTQLLELAAIIQGAFERAHFSAKAKQAEQLATVGLVGASIAHEIRNPLVSIKTFVQLLPTHYHDETFRDKFFKLIGDEVWRIDQLTEQLLDLASPRTYSIQKIDLHSLLESGIDLVSAKAVHRQIEVIKDFKANPSIAYTDASAAKQVLLNLCFNAIQAVENHTGERWVKISTRRISDAIEVAIADSGPGIPPEMRPRLFQPFQTTKSSGFGLGLAICKDILSNLNASITVDPLVSGCGAIFRVTFPCQPLSS